MWERSINLLPLVRAPTRDQACHPRMCPEQESHRQPFALTPNQLSHAVRASLFCFKFVFLLLLFFILTEDVLTDFREGKEVGERERNISVRNSDQLLLAHALPGDQTCSPGMCPGLELNPQPFGLLDGALTGPCRPGPFFFKDSPHK